MNGSQLATHGYESLQTPLGDETIDILVDGAPEVATLKGGVRNIFSAVPAYQKVLSIPEVRMAIHFSLGTKAVCVPAIFFRQTR
ncbi:MAG: hypothetical protein GY822_01385 [Deltaproteobacteria bacterium]|nr:hypothetical protein [Deltaproteobacteria bacterium]